MSISPASFQFIRGSILRSRPCFTPTQKNTIPGPSFRFGEEPQGTTQSLFSITSHATVQNDEHWAKNCRLTELGELYQRASECLYQKLQGNSRRTEPRELKTISAYCESAINWRNKAPTGFFWMQTGTQACLLQTSLLKPADCAVSPAPQPSWEFCLGWQQGRARLC